ncbi:hypothetical protein SAMN05428949_2428 [Chitinophaga sp. YR627]|uniref:hypothetical protein n=1 Tax=Chitinophaga sp. YR627 TaxID=1881041 RepID=UPI0008E225D6|nr:hypothetical protein [Chitinophaga sp. YR627]SFN32511.1 hypothetical protein SAMN05428949_2428 [Chitinophaga sp. YR627]
MEWNDQMIDKLLQDQAGSYGESYPEQFPDTDTIWTAINNRRKNKRIVHIRKIGALAAAACLLLTAVPLWHQLRKAAPIIVKGDTVPTPSLSVEKDAITYIRQLCAGNNIACKSPAFLELKAELDASTTELSAIDQEIRLFGDNEQLLRAKVRIENHLGRIIRSMLQII